ncbi:MAG: hypothetical protein OXC31_06855 [Spirochaetaceae bacterium]|nr:hypothetical protein [Spirochaetaceae bacterium]
MGLLTFGGPFTYDYWDATNRFGRMPDILNDFATIPTISPLYKPMLAGRSRSTNRARQHVASWPYPVVVTWITTEPEFCQHAVPPDDRVRFQAVLSAHEE